MRNTVKRVEKKKQGKINIAGLDVRQKDAGSGGIFPVLGCLLSQKKSRHGNAQSAPHRMDHYSDQLLLPYSSLYFFIIYSCIIIISI